MVSIFLICLELVLELFLMILCWQLLLLLLLLLLWLLLLLLLLPELDPPEAERKLGNGAQRNALEEKRQKHGLYHIKFLCMEAEFFQSK